MITSADCKRHAAECRQMATQANVRRSDPDRHGSELGHLAIQQSFARGGQRLQYQRRSGPMPRTEPTVQFRTFTSYAQDHTRVKSKALSSIEQNGAGAALV